MKTKTFLSHNSRDKPMVEQIARWLEDEAQIPVWLDKWNLIPGDPWQEEIENALDESQCWGTKKGTRNKSTSQLDLDFLFSACEVRDINTIRML